MKQFSSRVIAIALFVALGVPCLSGCEPERKGPLEKAGEKVDESVNDAKRAVEDATD